MSCPMGYGVRFEGGYHTDEEEMDNNSNSRTHDTNDVGKNQNNAEIKKSKNASYSENRISYSQYLGLDKLLSCQQLRSGVADQLVPDEHLFVIIHQAYELWFKQIIFDIDHVRQLLDNKIVDETKTLKIVSLLERTVRILKLLVDQMLVLETMSPLDFVEFRKYLTTASGFQSLQFRLLENKLGVASAHRVRYNSLHYREAFTGEEERQRIAASESEPSLFILIERWLARTPGIYEEDIVVENDSVSSFATENVVLSRSDSVADALESTMQLKNWGANLYDGSATRAPIESDEGVWRKRSLGSPLEWRAANRTDSGKTINPVANDDKYINNNKCPKSISCDELATNNSRIKRCYNEQIRSHANTVSAGQSPVNRHMCSTVSAFGISNSSPDSSADVVEEPYFPIKERNVSGQTDDETSQTAIKRKNFWNRYLEAVDKYLYDMKMLTNSPEILPEERRNILEEYIKTKRSFETITDEKQHQAFLDKGERRLSHNALKGALMIYFYRDMPRFSQPYQILTFLMDIDSLLQKWRYNHVILVQRMLGSKIGTGGSSGYMYLRTTVSDRYKVFLDLFNLSTWLIPRVYIPKLSPKMVKTLSEHSNLNSCDK